jgi:hypothetical protein
MSLKMSTGLRNQLLTGTAGSGSLRGILNGGVITLYTGDRPATPDAAVTGSLVCTFSAATFGTSATAGTVGIAASSVSGTCGIAGTVGYFRFSQTGDGGTASTTMARLEGVVGTPYVANVDLTLVNTVVIANQVLTVTVANVGFPES